MPAIVFSLVVQISVNLFVPHKMSNLIFPYSYLEPLKTNVFLPRVSCNCFSEHWYYRFPSVFHQANLDSLYIL